MYDLSNPIDLTRFRRRAEKFASGSGAVVELSEKRQRSLPQNRYLHLILGWYALETGNTLEYTKREYFKLHCNYDLFAHEVADRWRGKTYDLRSTRDLTTAELTTAIERFRKWSETECGIRLPDPEETAFLQAIEVEMSQKAEWI